jgi:hypothetical protein
MANTIPVNSLIPPKSPNLAISPVEYSRGYQDQFNSILRLYFNQLDDTFRTLLNTSAGAGGGKYIRFPYGAFQDTTTQTATANTATVATFNTVDYVNGVSVVTSGGKASRITVAQTGLYNLQWSGQFQNTDTQLHDVSVWLRVNGTDLTGSTGLASIPNSHGGVNGHTIVGWNFFLQLKVNEYVELYWSTDDVGVTIQAYAASTLPTRPSTASLVVTLSFVSGLIA